MQLAAPSAINGTLTLTSGKVMLDSFNLNMGTSATISGNDATKYIQTMNDAANGGALVRNLDNSGTPVLFPVGTSTYTPVRLVNTGASSGAFTARVFDGILTNGTSGSALTASSNTVNRTWLVENVSAGTYNVTMRLQWNESDESGSFYRTWCGIGHYTGGTWVKDAPLPSIAGTVANSWYRELSGLTSFSPFGVGDFMSPLPVKMVKFVAAAQNNDVKLDWSTASELNNDHFEIERSIDGKSWTKIGEVAGKGNSNILTNYSYTDLNVSNNNVVYYRLRQVDFNGSSELSNIVSVAFGKMQTITIESVQPNPFTTGLNINLNLLTSEHVSVRIIDMNGKEVVSQSYDLSKDNHVISLDNLDKLSSGMYMIQVSTASETIMQRLMKN
ncbi:MAG: T9SS type A sorting domain-containing protein [Bacteroidetes bacterium]|nr:T9SS type A sorting domain-containing protein [Bacteroidota bacterium]